MAALLLDTHTVLWFFAEDAKLARDVIKLIETVPVVYVSAITVWEISIKTSLGKLKAPANFDAMVERKKLQPLSISHAHAHRVRELPLYHKDPFDRMLVAQALCEEAILVTHDETLARYGCPVILC